MNRLSSTMLVIESNNTVVRAFARSFPIRGTILEVGSQLPPGAEELCDRRPWFPENQFLGTDIRPGPGVDRVEDARRLSFADGSMGAFMILETLEHIPEPYPVLAEAHRVLSDGGLLLISVPFYYRLHGFPQDYWRFSPSGFHELLKGFERSLVFSVGPRVTPATVWGIAVKGSRPEFPVEAERFRAALKAEAPAIRRRLFWSALQERGRDLLGLLLGRAQNTVAYFDPNRAGGYRAD